MYHGWAWPTCATSTTPPCKPNASCYCPTRAACFIRDTLVFVRAPSDVSSFVLTAISNENRELSHTTPEAAKSTLEAATCTAHKLESYSCCLTGTTLPLVLGVRQRCSRCRSDPCHSSRTAEYPPRVIMFDVDVLTPSVIFRNHKCSLSISLLPVNLLPHMAPPCVITGLMKLSNRCTKIFGDNGPMFFVFFFI